MQLFAEKRILSVSQLTSLVRGLLEENFEHVWVEGEVSNLAMPASGHFYFTLRDTSAQIRCVMYKASARALKFRPRDGLGLVVRGRLTVYEQRGDYQLLVEYLEPKGIGALQLAFVQLKDRLAKEGLFDEARKRPLPMLPQRIGIVTSATGAAIHDIITVISRRFANVSLLLRPVRVQGEGASAEIADAIHDFNQYGHVDVLIVGRGGGSLEDLWAFNEEVVARAIFQSRIPVVSAVGHEVDYTIADFVADLRAPTPSAAAELVVQSKNELIERLENHVHRLERAQKQRLLNLRSRLAGLHRGIRDPSVTIGHLGQRVDDFSIRLRQGIETSLRHRRMCSNALKTRLSSRDPLLHLEQSRERMLVLRARLELLVHCLLDSSRERSAVACARLQTLSPLATLGRGFSIVQHRSTGAVITDQCQLKASDLLNVRFHRGSALCRVEQTGNNVE